MSATGGRITGKAGGATSRFRYAGIAAIFGAALLVVLSQLPARAYHDQGYDCYTCHSLKPSEIRAGANAVRLDQPILGSIPTKPRTDRPLPGTGGYPVSCDFCHRSASDVPGTKFASKTYRHPVDLIQTGDNTSNVQEISCNDCHAGGTPQDVNPLSLVAKDNTDGYPDHNNLVAGYAHDLASNPPHLTQPYWGATLPGVNRPNDTTFWSAVRGNTQDIVCWECHASGRQSRFTQVTSTRLVKQDYTGAGRARGHQIRSNPGGAGNQLGVGAALPCYDCHDSHGSMSASLVLDNQSIYGSGTSQLAVTTFGGANDLVVCSQCHDTANPSTSTTKIAGVGKLVEGLHPVDPFNSTAFSVIHADAGITDNMLQSGRSCLANNGGCHASPHNPLGESTGGENCGVCHGSVMAAMDSGSSSGYHHVMLADNAPSGGVYPTNAQPTSGTSDRTCTICHVDHDLFSPQVVGTYQRSRNLRRDISLQPDNGTNAAVSTDFDNTLSGGGICTSCHQNTQTKNSPGTNIKSDGTTTTPVVARTGFSGSAHNYASSAPYIEARFKSDNTLYQANCTKCHNDTSQKKFQDNTSPYTPFSLHASDGSSAVNSLLAPLGYTPLTDNLGENFCYRCHSRTTDGLVGTRKGVSGKDWYNNANMPGPSEAVWGAFQKASRHPVAVADQKGGTAVVDCSNCHNPHLVGKSADNTAVSQPDNTYAVANIRNAAGPSVPGSISFCLACHDGAPPPYSVSASSFVPATVRVDNTAMNKAVNVARSHMTSGQGQMWGRVSCQACHDHHGGQYGKLLDNDSTVQAHMNSEPTCSVLCHNGGMVITKATGNNNTYCFRCHGDPGVGYPGAETDRTAIDNGYFALPGAAARFNVRWPGMAVYIGADSPHASTAKTFGGFDGITRNVSDCKTCHDVHGTANPYNQLKGTFRAGNYALCLQCHGKTATATDNISKYFPSAAGGDNTDSVSTTNVGHNIKTAGGYLAAGNALPCYDCHGTHGSSTGNTRLKSDQRWAGLGDTKYGAGSDNASRTFCLGCHMATDNVVAGTVENLNRQAGKLKLPTVNAIVEHTQGSGQGCNRCHYGKNYNDNTWGPHYPATGLCDTCHEGQGARSAAAATWNGAHRTHTDNSLYGFACKQCHSWTAASPAVHKDNTSAIQRAQVVFDNQATSGWDNTLRYALPFAYEYRSAYNNPYTGGAAVPTYAFAGADNATADARQPSVRWTNGTCGTVWCHSNANPLLDVNVAYQVGVSNVYQSPSWLLNSLSANCTGCHGGDAASGRMIGDNTSPTNGSIAHMKHVNGGLGCYKCHNNTVKTANNRQIDNVAGHVNATKDVAFDPVSVGGTWDNANKTCSGTSCHGGGGGTLPRWDNLATVSGCQSCHTGTGDIEDFGVNGVPSSMSNNNRTARLDNTEWTTRGHGRPTASGNYLVTGRPAANFAGDGQCLYCHDSSVGHDNTANPFRLANNNVYGNGWNDVCMVCHRKTGGHAGYNGGNATAAFVDNNHYSNASQGGLHTSAYNGGKFCSDCHDPHGDNNIYMVGKRAFMKTDNVFGIPLRSSIDDNTNRPAVAFTNNVNGSDYADNAAPINGICQVCHEAASGVRHYTTTGQIDVHFTSKCTTCHLHDAAFKGLGGPDVGQYFDRLAFANYPDNSSHPLRGLTTGDTTLRFGAQGSENCLGCHYGSGSGKTSDECLMCHFENVGSGGTPGALDGTRHMDRQLQLATVTGNTLPTSAYTISSIQNYDDWCLQCHQGTVVTLGGRAPSAASKTVIDPAAFTNGRHRAVLPPDGPIGCIYCHQPHGRSNAKLVRENPANRRTAAAGPTPASFNVYPNDNLGLGGYGTGQNIPFRSRPYWADNTLPYVPESDDDQTFCNTACHAGTVSQRKDRIIKRDATSGNFLLTSGNKKIYIVNGVEYTNDNALASHHMHPNGEIITTDNMVRYYATLDNLSGPSYYQYPFTGNSYPTAYNPTLSDLPFSYDFADGTRDFNNAYPSLGVRIAYRYTCSTCHNPHGTALLNAPSADGYPDMRLEKNNPSTLCNRCHK